MTETPAMAPGVWIRVLFRHRAGLLLLLAVPVVAAALRGTEIALTSLWLGTGVAGAGVLLRLWAARRIGRGARTRRPHASAGIIAVGPYRWCRNPLYVAAGLMLCGFGLLAGMGWGATALFPATLIAYTPVVLAEESALRTLFGDAYAGYVAAVPRWVGISRRYPAQDVALVRWREVFTREKWLVPGYVGAVIAIAALHAQAFQMSTISEHVELAVGVDLVVLTGLLALFAVVANAVKVEAQHQLRRLASRA
jgi:protein-S-isoprenylcysteine O-methyltransferase Ste14